MDRRSVALFVLLLFSGARPAHAARFVSSLGSNSTSYWSNLATWTDDGSGAFAPSTNLPTVSDTVLSSNGKTLVVDTNAVAGFISLPNNATIATLVISNPAVVLNVTTQWVARQTAGGTGTVFQSAGLVQAFSVTLGNTGGGQGEYHLTGGEVRLTQQAGGITVHSNSLLHIHGGQLTKDFNASSSVGLTLGVGWGMIRMESGSLRFTNGLITTAVDQRAALDVRGGNLEVGAQWRVHNQFKVTGSDASVRLGWLYALPGADFVFAFGETGVSPVAVSGFIQLSNATLRVDGSAYTGEGGSHVLFSCSNLASVVSNYNITITGFVNYPDAQVVQDTSLDVVQLDLGARLSPYTVWASGYGLSGTNAAYDADPEGDGIVNGFEYAIGGNPTDVGDEGLLPHGHAMPGGMEYVYRRHTNAAALGLNYLVQQATNLHAATWVTNGCEETGHGTVGDGFDQVTNRVEAGASVGTAARLRVDIVE